MLFVYNYHSIRIRKHNATVAVCCLANEPVCYTTVITMHVVCSWVCVCLSVCLSAHKLANYRTKVDV